MCGLYDLSLIFPSALTFYLQGAKKTYHWPTPQWYLSIAIFHPRMVCHVAYANMNQYDVKVTAHYHYLLSTCSTCQTGWVDINQSNILLKESKCNSYNCLNVTGKWHNKQVNIIFLGNPGISCFPPQLPTNCRPNTHNVRSFGKHRMNVPTSVLLCNIPGPLKLPNSCSLQCPPVAATFACLLTTGMCWPLTNPLSTLLDATFTVYTQKVYQCLVVFFTVAVILSGTFSSGSQISIHVLVPVIVAELFFVS